MRPEVADTAPASPWLIVTRPAVQAEDWVRRLQARGWRVDALPLLAIGPAPDPGQIRDLAAALQPGALVMFVSPNAVLQAMAAWPQGLAWPVGVRAAATGPGTVAALQAAGVPEAQIVAPDPAQGAFDSEALWARLQDEDWRERPVWVVRGEGGRDWFAETLRAAGAQVRLVQGYSRGAPLWAARERALLAQALQGPDEVLWLLSSSEAVDHLDALAPGVAWGREVAVVTHPRIAERAQALGFGQVHVVPVGIQALDDWLRHRP